MLRHTIMAVLGAVFLMGSASATTFIIKTEEQKIVESQRICAVQVKGLKTQKISRIIVTIATVSPIECFKGHTSKDFDVRWPGGSLQEKGPDGKMRTVTSTVPGTPRLSKGDTAVLYLWHRTEKDPWTVHSWVNGVLPIEYDQEAKAYQFRRRHLPAVADSDGENVRIRSNKDREKEDRSLKAFGEKVKRVLKEHSPN